MVYSDGIETEAFDMAANNLKARSKGGDNIVFESSYSA